MIKKEYEDLLYMEGNGEHRSHIQHEAMEQEAFFSWAKCMEPIISELRLLYHVPNGGKRNRAEAARLKRQGVKAGVPDIHLPVARGGFYGLYIELKADKKNKPTGKQSGWIQDLREQGYMAEVCFGWDEARELVLKYIKMRRTQCHDAR